MIKARSLSTTAFASLQWLFFIFANTIVVPISVGTAFALEAAVIAGLLRSSLIFTGIACLLQGVFGHRLPIMEGHSGVMWGLVLNLSITSASMGASLTEIGGGIAAGMLLSGGLIVVLGACHLLGVMKKVFTPMVISVFLLLLTFQLMKIFFEGMMQFEDDGALHLSMTLYSFAVVVFVVALKIKARPAIGNFSILIGIVVGWAVYALLFPVQSSENVLSGAIPLPIFPFGAPHWHTGIILTTFIATFINLSNTIPAVEATAQLMKVKASESRLNRSYILTGLYSVAGGVFGLVSYAPFASSIGFLESTRIFERRPFLISGGLMIVLGVIPALGGLLSTMPITVGNAVLFAAYMQLFGTSLKSVEGMTFDSVTIHRLAIPVLIGLSILHLDAAVFDSFPALLRPLLSNGFIVGVLLAIVLEKVVKWERA